MKTAGYFVETIYVLHLCSVLERGFENIVLRFFSLSFVMTTNEIDR